MENIIGNNMKTSQQETDNDINLLINKLMDEPPQFTFSSREMKNLFDYNSSKRVVSSDLVKRYLEMLLNRMELIHVENCIPELKYRVYKWGKYTYKNEFNQPKQEKAKRLISICAKLGVTPKIPAMPIYDSSNKKVIASVPGGVGNRTFDYVISLRSLLIACGKLQPSAVDKLVNSEAFNIKSNLTLDDINFLLEESVVGSSTYNISSAASEKISKTYDWYSHWFSYVLENHTTGKEKEKFGKIFNALTGPTKLSVMEYLEKFYTKH